MKCDIRLRGSVTVITPRGALVENVLAGLRERLAISGAGVRQVVDLSQVPYVDSGGIEFLLEVAGGHGSDALRPKLAELPETVREALNLTETLDRFAVFDTVDNAVRSFV